MSTKQCASCDMPTVNGQELCLECYEDLVNGRMHSEDVGELLVDLLRRVSHLEERGGVRPDGL